MAELTGILDLLSNQRKTGSVILFLTGYFFFLYLRKEDRIFFDMDVKELDVVLISGIFAVFFFVISYLIYWPMMLFTDFSVELHFTPVNMAVLISLVLCLATLDEELFDKLFNLDRYLLLEFLAAFSIIQLGVFVLYTRIMGVGLTHSFSSSLPQVAQFYLVSVVSGLLIFMVWSVIKVLVVEFSDFE